MTPAEFTAYIVSTGLTDEEIAHHLMVSKSTVRRWREGKNSPHPIMRPGAVEDLNKLKATLEAAKTKAKDPA